MGTYTVWIATGETSPEAAVREAEAISLAYDETENNDIPDTWPGLSYDYAEFISVQPTVGAIHEIQAGRPPDALVTDHCQIRNERPERTTDGHNFTPVSYGAEQMVYYLLDHPDQVILTANWHC